MLVAEDLSGDELCPLATEDVTADPDVWARWGFTAPLSTLGLSSMTSTRAGVFFPDTFGERGRERAKVRISFGIGLFCEMSHGVGRAS